MKLIKRAIHLDFHTMPGIPDFGQNFDAERFADTLKEARVEYVAAFAKCNIGFAYYPTKIGTPHPHLRFDMLGQMVEQCHKRGIAITAYFNVGLDHVLAAQRRDWAIQNKDGQVISGDRTANFFRVMCLNSGYRQHLLGMIREVIEQYPVDGIFLDCMNVQPCYGNECLCSIKQRGMDPLSDADVKRFAVENMIEFSREVKKLVGDEKYLYLNGQGYKETKGLRTHEEIECLPSGWGYDFFPAHAAYARNLPRQVFYMTGRFHKNWGDFGGLKSKASLQNDLWDAISNAVGVSIGDHMHPRDGLNPAVYKVIGELYRDLETLEPWTVDARAVADIAVLTPDERISAPQQGAVRMLGELKYTYDILDESMDFSPYKVLILPDAVPIGPVLKEKLETFLAHGGGIISSGESGLNPEQTAFALDAWNLTYEGQDPWNASFLKLREKESMPDLPDMPHAIHNQAIRMQLKPGAQPIADYIQPYFNRQWDGFHGSFYTPPDRADGRPALARSGNIFQFCFDLFTDYAEQAMAPHRQFLHYCLKQLLPDPLLKFENLPSTARLTLTQKKNLRMIHLKLTHPETRAAGRYGIIEDLPILHGAAVSLKTDAAKSVYLAPSLTRLPFDSHNGYIRIPLPPVEGYAMIVVET
jgi:hypothetical protein